MSLQIETETEAEAPEAAANLLHRNFASRARWTSGVAQRTVFFEKSRHHRRLSSPNCLYHTDSLAAALRRVPWKKRDPVKGTMYLHAGSVSGFQNIWKDFASERTLPMLVQRGMIAVTRSGSNPADPKGKRTPGTDHVHFGSPYPALRFPVPLGSSFAWDTLFYKGPLAHSSPAWESSPFTVRVPPSPLPARPRLAAASLPPRSLHLRSPLDSSVNLVVPASVSGSLLPIHLFLLRSPLGNNAPLGPIGRPAHRFSKWARLAVICAGRRRLDIAQYESARQLHRRRALRSGMVLDAHASPAHAGCHRIDHRVLNADARAPAAGGITQLHRAMCRAAPAGAPGRPAPRVLASASGTKRSISGLCASCRDMELDAEQMCTLVRAGPPHVSMVRLVGWNGGVSTQVVATCAPPHRHGHLEVHGTHTQLLIVIRKPSSRLTTDFHPIALSRALAVHGQRPMRADFASRTLHAGA
ncbi:hypothetical protein C8R47DRAFT_1080567 [Mycena vitilis]|nr:hypothetical protein C8R47DRAFT_1080567 [Mycena vitilis]